MDKNSEVIENFESLLKQQSATRSISLYNGKLNRNTAGKSANHKLNPQSILSNLAKQMKALQSSENFKSCKKPPPQMEKYKTSAFLPVNMLEGQKKQPHPPDPQKFDTQVVSNTQLINIVENAEALDVNVGMTQEFETTFFKGDGGTEDQESQNPTHQETIFPILDISLKEPDPKPVLSPQKLQIELQINTDTQFDNYTQILDQCIDFENIDKIGKITDDSAQEQILLSPICDTNENKGHRPINEKDYVEAPLSPVFNVKNKKFFENTPYLVYDLERFETFEKVAMPVIQQAQDTDQAKILINSQIIGKELILQTRIENMKRISPIIEICDNPLKVDKELISTTNKYLPGKEDISDRNLKLKDTEDKGLDKSFLEDEILFSSDEENEYQSQSYKDLPFTCALETSFYESVDVLDKTMYVGFQTASNKSIQIDTVSFSKAKSLLDTVEEDLKDLNNEATITELIDLCESNKEYTEQMGAFDIANVRNNISPEITKVDEVEYEDKVTEIASDTDADTASVHSTKAIDILMEVDLIEPDCQGNASTIIEITDAPDSVATLFAEKENFKKSNASFEGFKTASNKPIHPSEKALAKSKHMLQNLDVDKSFEFNVKDSGKIVTSKSISPCRHLEQIADSTEQNIDDDIIRKFHEEIMHTELEDIMKNIDNNVYKRDSLSGRSQRHCDPKSVEFQTASNETIPITDIVFQDYYHIDFTSQSIIKNLVPENPNVLDNNSNNPIKNIAFRTASNKEITISNEALAKTKHIFNDNDMNDKDNIDQNKKGNLAYNSNNDKIYKLQMHVPEGIISQSSTNKPAEIKASYTIGPQIQEFNSETCIKTSQINKTQSCGLKTDSDKNLNVSAEALSKNKKVPNHSETNVNDKDMDAEPPFCGFEQNYEFLGLIQETLEKSQKIVEKLCHNNNNEKKADMSKQQTEKPSQEVTASSVDYLKPDISRSFNSGFKTASNKDVKISERALAKSKIIFQDIDNGNLFDTNNVDPVNGTDVNTKIKFRGFQTASNREVKISEEASAKSRKIFQDVNKQESMETTNETFDKNGDTKFKGFRTASNKQVKISEQALAKSKRLFQDINQIEAKTEAQFKGFQTASNKEVNISEEALARSRKIFQDISDHETVGINSRYSDKNTSFFKGFQTASNKEVKISAAALEKSRKLFEDISDVKCELQNKEVINAHHKNDLNFKGFETASNKEVKISPDALSKSRKLFQDINDNTSAEINNTDQNTKQLNENKPLKVSKEALAKSRKIFQDINDEMTTVLHTSERLVDTMPYSNFMGFQTASKKQVNISEEALARSRKLFEDINNEISTNSITQEDRIDSEKSISFKGFQTASNKEIKISEKALSKSRKIFQDINEENTTEMKTQDNTIKASSSTFTGFQTASKKQVNISEEALVKSRKIFEAINSEKIAENINELDQPDVRITSTFKSFQTASKKEVKVSEEALKRSKKMFQDIDNAEPEIDESINNHVAFKGFQTASKKTVTISEEAIAKSRKLFQDVDLCLESYKMPCKRETQSDAYLKSKRKDSVLNTTPKILLTENSNKGIQAPKPKIELKFEQKCSENFEDIDTQILNNFEVSMHEVTPKKSKRSGSPILSCPKSKKRKVFQIPYSQKSPKKSPEVVFKPPTVQKPENIYNFNSTYKKTKRLNLKDLQKLEVATTSTENIDPYIQEFDFDNILEIEFTGPRNDINDSVLTVPELKDLFLNSVNKKLVPDGWIEIQLKLIIWKLISYELKFPKTMHLTCTAKNVIEQLKFRYDKELYNAERPALRKIFEKDDTSTKTLIVCVVAIYPAPDTSQPPELLLTDGWYTIKAVIDKMLAKFVSNGKITVGTKLVTHGAELVGSDQAVSPWEDTSSFRLKLFGNSTRRARWDARLGYHGNGAILSQLSNVALDGGKISKLRVFVSRVYPALYVDKFEDGSTVTRSERLEHLHQMKFESERQSLLEKIYEEVEKEVMDQASQDSDGLSESGCKRKLDSGSQIAKKLKKCRDPAEFRSHLTSTQAALLEDHTSKERETLIQAIQTRVQEKIASLGVTLNRNVVTLCKVRVAGVNDTNNGVQVSRALLSIWRPNEAVIEMIKEGTWIEILNVVPTAMRYSELQISAGRQSVFSLSKYKESETVKPYTVSLKRTCYQLKDLVKHPGMTTDYNEIDTVGIIFEIDPSGNNFDEKKHQFQNVYLTDLEKNMISVNFWGGLKKFGFENVLDTGQIVACTNLQKRAGNSRKNIPQYRVTEFSYFTKTPKSETARNIIEELSQKLTKIDKMKFFEECVSLKTNYSTKQQTNENVTPYRFPNFDVDSSKNRIYIDSPLAQNYNKKDENLNLSGLDFESTFKQDTQDLSPRTLLRKRQVKEKIEKLKRYGEPPPLSPIQIINKSKNAASAFKSPFSKSDISPSVAICAKNLPNPEEINKCSDTNIQCSPVIALNRTYVKWSNPVKLNFSKNENSLNDNVDEFAEDFDCSPPLSLD